jgi:hypothetical protein
MAQKSNSTAGLYGVGVGTTSASSFASNPNVQTRNPDITDIKGPEGAFPIGKVWVNSSTGSVYVLASLYSSSGNVYANWVAITGTTGAITEVDGDSGAATPTAGTISILGTTNEVTTAASGSVIFISIPGSFTAPGTMTSNGDITTNGNFVRATAGSKDVYSSVATTTSAGGNCAGTVSLSSGVVTVQTTAVTANSVLRFSRVNTGVGVDPIGVLVPGVLLPGVSFAMESVDPSAPGSIITTDNSEIFWEIVN